MCNYNFNLECIEVLSMSRGIPVVVPRIHRFIARVVSTRQDLECGERSRQTNISPWLAAPAGNVLLMHGLRNQRIRLMWV